MKKNTALLVLLFLAYSCNTNKKEPSNKRVSLISNITIISTSNDLTNSFIGSVVVEDDKIVSVGNRKPVLSGSYNEIDGTGKFIIPGLIDSHIHLANTAGFNGKLKSKYPELVEAYFVQLPKSYLYHGFTTLIDVNNYAPKLIDKISQTPLHPDIYTCGNQVLVMDDFNMEMEEYSQEQRYQSPFLYDNYNTQIVFPDSINLDNHTPRQLISEIKNQNGVGVKIAYEDEASGLNVTWAKPSLGILSDLVQEASTNNLPVLIHAPSLEGHQIALKAGVTIFAHGLWNWIDNFEEEFNKLELSNEHKDVLKEIANKQLGYQLTFRAITGEQDLIHNNFLLDKNLEHVYPKEYLNVLKTSEGNWGREKILGRAGFLKRTNPSFYNAMKGNFINDDDMWPDLYELYKSRLNIVARFLEDHDANFILGSDTPAMNMYTNPPGYNSFLEMKHMFEAGVSLETIFKAATINNAKAFHLETMYGKIEESKIANMLILNSSPLETVEAYNDIDKVIINGKVISREQLSALHK